MEGPGAATSADPAGGVWDNLRASKGSGRVVLPTEPHGSSPHIEAQVRAEACQNQFAKGRGGGGGGEGAARGRGRLQGPCQQSKAGDMGCQR